MSIRNYLGCGLLVSMVSLFGCSSVSKTTALGGGVGSGIGGLVGAIADPGPRGANRVRNVLIGSAVGGAIGTGSGYLLGKKLENDRDEEYRRGKSETSKDISMAANMSDGRKPKLLAPRTEARWVPDQVRGSTFVPGHFEYVILEGARWESAP